MVQPNLSGSHVGALPRSDLCVLCMFSLLWCVQIAPEKNKFDGMLDYLSGREAELATNRLYSSVTVFLIN